MRPRGPRLLGESQAKPKSHTPDHRTGGCNNSYPVKPRAGSHFLRCPPAPPYGMGVSGASNHAERNHLTRVPSKPHSDPTDGAASLQAVGARLLWAVLISHGVTSAQRGARGHVRKGPNGDERRLLFPLGPEPTKKITMAKWSPSPLVNHPNHGSETGRDPIGFGFLQGYAFFSADPLTMERCSWRVQRLSFRWSAGT